MNHSPSVIKEFVCEHYSIPESILTSSSRQYRIIKARQMIVLLAGKGSDEFTASEFKQSRSNQTNARKVIKSNMQFDRNLRNEFEQLKRELLNYEIS